MRMDEIKVGNCIICGTDMPIINKRQRFCSDNCRNEYWNAVYAKRRKENKEKRDLFGFSIAAE